jgi:hypothetical protein
MRGRLILGILLALVGLVWIGQGTGILSAGGGFMVGDIRWALIGAILVAIGIVIGVSGRRRPAS